MISTKQIGQSSENSAAQFLQQRGLKLLTSNYSCRLGEIDLIMQDDDQVVFVEVRYRKQQSHGDGCESVTISKQKKIIKTAYFYLQKNDSIDKVPCRFDVVTLDQTHQINWIKDAFEAYY